MKTDNKRVPLWDNLKGVLIFLVVFAHCIYGIADNAVLSALVKIIYLFHMPAFVFISGRLGRSERSQSAPALLKLAFSFLIFNGFVGDSLTEGTKNGGVPWHEPIEPSLEGKTVSNFSKGGCTVSYISENVNGIPASELYVVAI